MTCSPVIPEVREDSGICDLSESKHISIFTSIATCTCVCMYVLCHRGDCNEYTVFSYPEASQVSLWWSELRLCLCLPQTFPKFSSLSVCFKVMHLQIQPPLLAVCAQHYLQGIQMGWHWEGQGWAVLCTTCTGGGKVRRFLHFICVLKGRNRTLQTAPVRGNYCKSG